MAAAAWVRYTEVVGFRTTKGLFIMFTLLSLVCFTSSFFQVDMLTKIKETHERNEEEMEGIKAQRESLTSISSGLMNDYLKIIDQLMPLAKYESPESVGVLEKSKALLLKTKAFVDRTNEDLGVRIHDTEKTMMETKNLIRVLEEQQAEL